MTATTDRAPRPTRRSDHDRDHPQRVRLLRAGHERDADPQLLHADHLRGQGLLGRDPRRARRRARPVARPAALPRQPRDLREARRRDVRLGRVPARRRLLHERLVHDRHAPERRDDLRADLTGRTGSSASRPRGRTGSTSAARTRAGRWTRREIYQEGMRWAPTRIYDRGEPREDIIDLLRAERTLRLLAGRRHERPGRGLPHRRGALPGDPRPLRLRDLRRGARRDLPPVRSSSSARRWRRSRTGRTTPTASSTTTGSATARSRSSCASTSQGDEMTIDLDGSSPQMEGPVNCGFAQTISACRVAFKLLINPSGRSTAARSTRST